MSIELFFESIERKVEEVKHLRKEYEHLWKEFSSVESILVEYIKCLENLLETLKKDVGDYGTQKNKYIDKLPG